MKGALSLVPAEAVMLPRRSHGSHRAVVVAAAESVEPKDATLEDFATFQSQPNDPAPFEDQKQMQH